ncbi:MAG: tRNA epoxyqueuosine(34) reductase QueG [Anaerolineales bacterium]|nr:tRNA epoxyqueuosine(34) reductase QueG [Anaerolineales bacterium]
MPSPQELKEKLIAKAHELGFVLAGITTPDPTESYPRFESWISAGYHAGMDWMASEHSLERRNDPQKIMPACQSILMLGIPCLPSRPENSGIAAYALGDDYHDILPRRLEALSRWLNEITGEEISSRWYTDTGPLLERDLARRAGLGWIGKNSMLISPDGGGSYFLLAEILLGIALPPDTPFAADHCGSCTRCLDACPTGCILPGRTLDANRCISYLTIENKGGIPLELRPLIGEWQFGCDVCQQVCPWNRFSFSKVDPAFAPREGVPPENLAAEFSLTPQAFNRKFKGSPVKRARRRGYLRNTAVVLGNGRGEDGIEGLSIALIDTEPLVRSHAAWALGQIGGKQAVQLLRRALEVEAEAEVVGEIISALERNGG